MFNPVHWIATSIRRKAIAGLLIILLSAVFFIGLSIASQARGFILAGVQRRASSVARFIGTDLASAIEQSGPSINLEEKLDRIVEDPSILFISVFDETGRLVDQKSSGPAHKIIQSLPLGELYDMKPEDVRYYVAGDILEVYRIIESGHDLQKFYILLGVDITEVSSIVAKITRIIAINAFVVYILGLLVLIAAVNRLTEPLTELASGIKDLGRGKLPQPVPVTGTDEVGTLSDNFNKMIEDLRSYRHEVERYQKHLEEMVGNRTKALNSANMELTRMNESLKAANDKLLELDMLKSNFLGIATHELKTPLSVVGGYLDSLQDGFAGDLNDSQKGIVVEALSSCHRMEALISDMLDLNKIEAGRMPMEIHDLPVINAVQKVAGQMIPLLQKKKLTLDIEEDQMDITAKFDEDRVIQVLVNLIGNAIKFTPEGGRITVSAAQVSVEGSDHIRISVADTGIGISPDDLPHVFEEFAQVGEPGKEEGTGLGLAICLRIIKAHEGEIWAESELGKGTTFYFTLPMAEQSKIENPKSKM